jgi:hypothetical protein
MRDHDLRDHLEDLARRRPAAEPADVRPLVARTVRRYRRRRALKVSAVAVAAATAVAVGLIALPAHHRATTQVTTTGPTPTSTAPSTALIVLRAGHLQVLDAATGKVERTVAIQGGTAQLQGPMSIDPAGRTVYLTRTTYGHSNSNTCVDDTVVAINVATGDQTTVVDHADDPAVSPDGRLLAYVTTAAACRTGNTVVRNLTTGSTRSWDITTHPKQANRAAQQITSLTWAPDSRRLAVGSMFDPRSGIQILDTARSRSATNPTTVDAPGASTSPSILPDGRIIAVRPFCPDDASCPPLPAGSIVSHVDVLAPTTGAVISSVGSTQQLTAVTVDRSGQKVEVFAGTDLYRLADKRFTLTANNVAAAVWLPASVHAPAPAVVNQAAPVTVLRDSDFEAVAPITPLTGITTADGAIYVTDSSNGPGGSGGAGDSVVDRVDPTTGKVTASARFPSPNNSIASLTQPVFANGAIWVGGTSIDGLDPVTLRVRQQIAAPKGVDGLAAAGGKLWVLSAGRLYETPFVQAKLTLVSGAPKAFSVAANPAGTILAVSLPGLVIERLDPITGKAVARYNNPIEGNNIFIDAIAGQIAWSIEGGGHYNSATGLNLVTGQVLQLSGLNSPLPPVVFDNGQGGGFSWSGQTLLATTVDGPNWCIDPATGRAQRVIAFPKSQQNAVIGAAGHWLYAIVGDNRTLARARIPGCA